MRIKLDDMDHYLVMVSYVYSVIFVKGDSASGDRDFAETLQRTLGDLARSTHDIQVCKLTSDDIIKWHFLHFLSISNAHIIISYRNVLCRACLDQLLIAIRSLLIVCNHMRSKIVLIAIIRPRSEYQVSAAADYKHRTGRAGRQGVVESVAAAAVAVLYCVDQLAATN